MRARFVLVIAASLVIASTPSWAGEWKAVGPGNGRGERLTLAVDDSRTYTFECASDAIAITETGVTDLIDIRAGGAKIGDMPGSTMSPGASVMALFTGKGEPD